MFFTIKFIKGFFFLLYMVEANYDEYNNKLVNDSADITFECPNCGKGKISRVRKARELAREYKCPECGFVGP